MAVGREYSCMYISAAAMFRHMRLHQKRKKENTSVLKHIPSVVMLLALVYKKYVFCKKTDLLGRTFEIYFDGSHSFKSYHSNS